MLPFFPEVGHAQALGGLILPLVAHGGEHKHNQGDDIGQHLVQLLHGKVCSRGDEQIQDVQSAEEDGAENAHIGPPDGEDHQSNCQPATVTEGIVGPDAAGVVHNIIQSAQARDHGADAGRLILIAGDVDTRCIGGSRALAHCPELQAHPGLFQHIGGHQRNDDGRISQEAIGKEQFAEYAGGLRNGQGLAEIAGGGRQGDGGDLRAGELDERAAEEIAEAHAEGGHGQARDVLVGPERHRQEAIQQPHEQAACQAAQQGDHNS